MEYLKTFNESLNTDKYKVIIKWSHGDDDYIEKKKYSFSSEDETRDFLNFIFDLRKLYKLKPHPTVGIRKDSWHFSDGHYEGIGENVRKVMKKHSDKYMDDYIPFDKSCGGCDHYTTVDNIKLKVNGQQTDIYWMEALNKPEHIINLRKIGEEFMLSTGNISGYNKLFGEESLPYQDIWKVLGHDDNDSNYPEIKVKVIDIKENDYRQDCTKVPYVYLCEITDDRVKDKLKNNLVCSTTEGYDPTFTPTHKIFKV